MKKREIFRVMKRRGEKKKRKGRSGEMGEGIQLKNIMYLFKNVFIKFSSIFYEYRREKDE